MKSILIYDTNNERLCRLGLLLRLAKYPFHVVGSLEEACNQVATQEDSVDRYHCLLINNVDTPRFGDISLTKLAQHNFPLSILLIERFHSHGPKTLAFQDVKQLQVLRCSPGDISEALSLVTGRA